jgi:peptide/nickel transport system ATP-binding protein
VFAGARHPYSRALSAAFPTVGDVSERRNPRGLAGDPPDPAALPGGCAFHPRCPVVMEHCAATDVELYQVRDGWQSACLRAREEAAGDTLPAKGGEA